MSGEWRQNSKYWTLCWGRACTLLLQVDHPQPCLVCVPQLKPYIHLTAEPKRERMQLSWFSSPFPNWQFVLQTRWSNISYVGYRDGLFIKKCWVVMIQWRFHQVNWGYHPHVSSPEVRHTTSIALIKHCWSATEPSGSCHFSWYRSNIDHLGHGRWEDTANIKMDMKERGCENKSGFIGLKIDRKGIFLQIQG